MQLRNSTDIPDALIREIIRFVVPHGVTNYGVRVAEGSHSFRGRASPEGSGGRVRIWIGPALVFPLRGYGNTGLRTRREARFTMWYKEGRLHHTTTRRVLTNAPRGGYLPRPALGSRVEALVYVIAHELRHLWQGVVPRGHRVWGARGQYSERDADAYAIRMLRAWRRRES
jgi:hypothetical protein